jgi:branched-subunit amino acid aminotransferase/4-amino-4-deoxychorismate lyase
MMSRTEHDPMGAVEVPENAYYGAQTQRAVENFKFSTPRFGVRFIWAHALIKAESARVNQDLGLDWGFTRSDVTYDVVHAWQGRFFRLDDHLDRFFSGMERLRLDTGLDQKEIAERLHGCVAASGLRDAYVEMLCTRGQPPVGLRDPRLALNRFVAFAVPFVWIDDERQRADGLRVNLEQWPLS